MLDCDPTRRRAEYEKLNACGMPLFPPIFEKFLYNYMKEFRQTAMPADEIITKWAVS